jgi:hypothetical protein
MNRFLPKCFSQNPKPVLSHAEGSAIQNRKWVGTVALFVAFVSCGAVGKTRSKGTEPTQLAARWVGAAYNLVRMAKLAV